MDKIIPKSTNAINSEGLSECFSTFTTKLYVSLAPSHINNPINGIKAQHLDSLLMNYFPKAEGVVISYSNINILKDGYEFDDGKSVKVLGKISASSPFTFLWITVDFLIWKPQINDLVEGYIYLQTASHISLLINDTFNASIKKFNIPQSWEFIPQQADEIDDQDSKTTRTLGYWCDENGSKVEGKIKFMIKNIYNSSRVVSVEGSLIQPGSEVESQPVSRKRRFSVSIDSTANSGTGVNKHKKFDDDDDENDNNNEEAVEDEKSVIKENGKGKDMEAIKEDTETPQYDSNSSDSDSNDLE